MGETSTTVSGVHHSSWSNHGKTSSYGGCGQSFWSFLPIRSGHNYFLKLCLLDNLIVSVALVVLLFEEDKVTEEGLDMTLTELYAMFSP